MAKSDSNSSTEESVLASKFADFVRNSGATLKESAKFSGLYNLDFVITDLEEVHAHVNLGVHITTTSDNVDEISDFLSASSKGIILKGLYIEISEELIDLDDPDVSLGGFAVAFGACLAALFDERHSNAKVLGVKIKENYTFQFFALDESVERLERIADSDDMSIGEELEGRIIAYFTEKGFGFIQNHENRKYFFHIANVVDDDLRSRLPGYVLGEIIPVVFQYGGNDGKKYPKAINVSLSDHDAEYFDEDFDSEAYDI